MFNTKISILLNTEKVSIPNFNITKIFGIIPEVPKIPKCTTFSAKESKKIFNIFGIIAENTELFFYFFT